MKHSGREFSKVVLAAAIVTYEITVLFGIYIVGANDNSLLPDCIKICAHNFI